MISPGQIILSSGYGPHVSIYAREMPPVIPLEYAGGLMYMTDKLVTYICLLPIA